MAGNDVGGEFHFAYVDGGLRPAAGDQTVSQEYGVSTAGFGIFGGVKATGSSDRDGQSGVGGGGYALVPADGAGTVVHTNGTANQIPYVQNSVVFTFGGWGNMDPEALINDVRLQWGTNTNETTDNPPDETETPVPEASSIAVWLVGLMGLAVFGRRRNADRR